MLKKFNFKLLVIAFMISYSSFSLVSSTNLSTPSIALSYAILTHNDSAEQLDKLISFLLKHKKQQDEIVVVDDFSTNDETTKYLENAAQTNKIKYSQHSLDYNFGQQKNFLISQCSNNWIFNIDSDELPSEYLIQNIHDLIKKNDSVDLIWVPRINFIYNDARELTIERASWPDHQARVFKNSPKIRWTRPIHERLAGINNAINLPAEDKYAITHHCPCPRSKGAFYEDVYRRWLRQAVLENNQDQIKHIVNEIPWKWILNEKEFEGHDLKKFLPNHK